MTKEEHDKKYGVGSGYAKRPDFLFNPEKNKSTLRHGPEVLSDPPVAQGGCCGPIIDQEIKPGKIIMPGDVVEKDGHAAFDIRICKVCGSISNRSHRDECDAMKVQIDLAQAEEDEDAFLEDWDPEKYEIDFKIRRINNGYVVSGFLDGDVYFKGRTAIMELIRKKLRKLKDA